MQHLKNYNISCVCVQTVKDKKVIFDPEQFVGCCGGAHVDDLSRTLVYFRLHHTTASSSGKSKCCLFFHQDPSAEQLLPLLFLDYLGLRIITASTEKADSNHLLFRFAHRWFHLSTTIDRIWGYTKLKKNKKALDWRVTVVDFREYVF